MAPSALGGSHPFQAVVLRHPRLGVGIISREEYVEWLAGDLTRHKGSSLLARCHLPGFTYRLRRRVQSG